ncbi:N-acetyltransferase 9 [Heterostelium album PN500]|uniref:N-acetyltransferase 9-like protein n=1 Tax=Heterostelium pallidum (strain ATCC 26659 / Pp 5 / PN500) TaxID=670386 RepID=D3B0P6_HETP5|nr:N-acetyltransferase 9 [Heterostelium album PN500]EFA84870.1 N-acetyltransferase 9 [Heterostelium album PN500]|eukprot:XP_020436981.1 N-acetyltransferase 9 [Heterostelium album PN500]
MLFNYGVLIVDCATSEDKKSIGNNIVLVPYKAIHVEKYHKWMQSEEIRELTASDLLTLEEEYENQQSWYEDSKKCTFIILDKEKIKKDKDGELLVESIVKDYLDSMAGDVNLFWNEYEEEGSAEVEVMIAEPSCRRRGFGSEAIEIMMHYAVTNLSDITTRFIVKIGESNTTSIQLFKKLGFQQVGQVNVFKEINMIFEPIDQIKSWKQPNQLKLLSWIE